MDALTIGQPVTLELDGGLSPLDCVVTAIAGETATLVQTGLARDELTERLEAGSGGFLVIGRANSVLGLRGAAIITPQSRPLIDFVVTDTH
jgi:hypothetical protein